MLSQKLEPEPSGWKDPLADSYHSFIDLLEYNFLK